MTECVSVSSSPLKYFLRYFDKFWNSSISNWRRWTYLVYLMELMVFTLSQRGEGWRRPNQLKVGSQDWLSGTVVVWWCVQWWCTGRPQVGLDKYNVQPPPSPPPYDKYHAGGGGGGGVESAWTVPPPVPGLQSPPVRGGSRDQLTGLDIFPVLSTLPGITH